MNRNFEYTLLRHDQVLARSNLWQSLVLFFVVQNDSAYHDEAVIMSRVFSDPTLECIIDYRDTMHYQCRYTLDSALGS
jgi:hypothetical protein